MKIRQVFGKRDSLKKRVFCFIMMKKSDGDKLTIGRKMIKIKAIVFCKVEMI